MELCLGNSGGEELGLGLGDGNDPERNFTDRLTICTTYTIYNIYAMNTIYTISTILNDNDNEVHLVATSLADCLLTLDSS